MTGDVGFIEMVCHEPLTPDETGHPLFGQVVHVTQSSSGEGADLGDTGGAANSIIASLS
jgi:hypothetical protein